MYYENNLSCPPPTTNYQNKKRYGKLYTHHTADLLFTYMFYINACSFAIAFTSSTVKLVTSAIISKDKCLRNI